MANLTISVDDGVLRRARIRALERGTSVNAVLREYLEAFSGAGSREKAIDSLLRQSRHARTSRGGRRFTREDLHER